MSTQLTEALATVRSEVDAFVGRVAPSASKRPRFDNAKRQSCNDLEGAPTGDVRSQFGYLLSIGEADEAALLSAASDYFTSRGLTVNADHENAVFAEGDGFSYSAVLNSAGELVVGGTTPCFASG